MGRWSAFAEALFWLAVAGAFVASFFVSAKTAEILLYASLPVLLAGVLVVRKRRAKFR
jgi:hypothetical protein